MVPNGNEFVEMKVPAKAVNALLSVNKKATDERLDVAYLKTILIGFCTLKKIQESESIDEGVLEVVKGNIYSF